MLTPPEHKGVLGVQPTFTLKLRAKGPVTVERRAMTPPLVLECEYRMISGGKPYHEGKVWTLPVPAPRPSTERSDK